MTLWTDERHERVLQLLREGATAREAGDAVGITRNAVVGRLARAGFKISDFNGHIGHRSTKRWKRLKGRLPRPVFKSKPVKVCMVIKMLEAKPPAMIDLSRKCQFADLNADRCHWPLWGNSTRYEDKFYCGAPTFGSTYCQAHWEVGTVPRPRRREPSRPFSITNRSANPPKSNVA